MLLKMRGISRPEDCISAFQHMRNTTESVSYSILVSFFACITLFLSLYHTAAIGFSYHSGRSRSSCLGTEGTENLAEFQGTEGPT